MITALSVGTAAHGSAGLATGRHHFDVGQRFELHMPLPEVLRPRFGDREVYKVVGVVRRVEVPDGSGLYRVACQLLGEPE